MKKPLIVLTGPTAVGKTDLSIRLARLVDGEIISADSMQVYRGMDIGSAKIRLEEMGGICHHLIDVLDPKEEFHVVRFKEMVNDALETVYSHGRIPILAGGTGFYIQAVLYDIDFTENGEDLSYRKELERLAAEKGPGFLHDLLREKDPVSAKKIHANNVKRVIRALEYYEETKEPISLHNQREREKSSAYNSAYFVLNAPRPLLYERIDRRVDEMLEAGLVEEVQRLKSQGCDRSLVSMQGLGYKEILAYLDGEMSLEEAVYILKRDTRHFAKRQLTWFKREKDVIWVEKDAFDYDNDRILSFMEEILTEKNILKKGTERQ